MGANKVNQHDLRVKESAEETSFLRQEIKRLMTVDPVLHNVKNHFLSKGIDRFKIDIILTQVFKDREEKEKFLTLGRKRRLVSLVFLVLFAAGVVGWFYIYGDWITYFAGANLVLFLFFLQQSSSYQGRAAIFD